MIWPSIIGLILASSLLALQVEIPSNPFDGEIELEQARKAMVGGPKHQIATVIGVYEDGTPMHKGYIGCGRNYFRQVDKKDEDQIVYDYYQSDSRGAVVFLTYLSDEYMKCYAEKDGKKGQATKWFDGSGRMVMEIILR